MSKQEIKIFLVDDHEVVLNGLKAMLNPVAVPVFTATLSTPEAGVVETSGEFRVIGTAPDAETMLQRLSHLPAVDLLIVDYELAGMNGVEAAKAAKEQHKHLKTIVFSMHCSQALVQFARQHYVDAFVTKGEGLQRLAEAIRKVMKGHEVYPPVELQDRKSALMPPTDQQVPAEKDMPLSRREREVLCRIAKGMTSQQISKELNIAFNTVEVHRRNLMQKLDIHKVAGLVKYAMEAGIVC